MQVKKRNFLEVFAAMISCEKKTADINFEIEDQRKWTFMITVLQKAFANKAMQQQKSLHSTSTTLTAAEYWGKIEEGVGGRSGEEIAGGGGGK